LSNELWEDWTLEVWINKGKDLLLFAGEGNDTSMKEYSAPSFADSVAVEECAIARTIFDSDLENNYLLQKVNIKIRLFFPTRLPTSHHVQFTFDTEMNPAEL
jgi:hypothetical protein